MQTTVRYLGHAGFIVEHRGVRLLIDPWFYPAFLQSWFPLPDNRDQLPLVTDGTFDYLYVSHTHEDHFDRRLLEKLDRRIHVIVANYRSRGMTKRFRALGYEKITALDHKQSMELGPGFGLTMFLDTSHKEDSGVLLDLDGFKFLDLNDCNTAFSELPSGIDVLASQHSGAMWYPNCYDYPPDVMAEKVADVRKGLMDTLCRKVAVTGARYYVPSAGPACFLDPVLDAFNDPHTTIFPQWKHVAAAFGQVHPAVSVAAVDPGDRLLIDTASGRMDLDPGPRHGVAENLDDYRARRADEWGAFNSDAPPVSAAALEAYFSTLQRRNRPLVQDFRKDVQLVAGNQMWALRLGQLSEHFVIDTEEPLDPEYVFVVPPAVLHAIIDGETGWEEALLSMRIALRRNPDTFDLTLFSLLRYGNEPAQTMQVVRERQNKETIERDGLCLQRYCPHAGEDLTFATIKDGVVECPRHHWRWDARTGRCLSGGSIPLRVTVLDPAHPSLDGPTASVATDKPDDH